MAASSSFKPELIWEKMRMCVQVYLITVTYMYLENYTFSPVTDHIVHSAHGLVVSTYHQLLIQFQTSEVLRWKWGGETSSFFLALFSSASSGIGWWGRRGILGEGEGRKRVRKRGRKVLYESS